MAQTVRFKCCDHCGNNFPVIGESCCDMGGADMHVVPCNEPGCEKGTEPIHEF